MAYTRYNWTRVVRSLILKLQLNGIKPISVDDGDGEPQNLRLDSDSAIRQQAAEIIASVDSSTLMVMHQSEAPGRKNETTMAWLTINLCVDPEEILSDWRVRQDTDLAGILDRISTEFSEQWEGKPVPTEVVT